jgi:hypothetical protein
VEFRPSYRHVDEDLIGNDAVIFHVVDDGEFDGGGRADEVLVVVFVEFRLDGSKGKHGGSVLLSSHCSLADIILIRIIVLLIWLLCVLFRGTRFRGQLMAAPSSKILFGRLNLLALGNRTKRQWLN